MVLKPLPDEDIICNSCYPHVIFLGKQRSCKDICLVKDIYSIIRDNISIFDMWFQKEFLEYYETSFKYVFANCWLDDSYFPSGVSFERVTSIEQIDTLRNGILFLHDAELLFNSRGSLKDKDMEALLQVVNNAGKHGVPVRASCHREKSLDVKLRSLNNLWIEPVPYHTSRWLSSFSVVLNIYDSNLKRIGFDVVDGLHKYAPLYNTSEEAYKIKKGNDVGFIPLGQKPMSYNQIK